MIHSHGSAKSGGVFALAIALNLIFVLVEFRPRLALTSSVRCVPFSASHEANFSVSFGENRCSDSVGQGRLHARSKREWGQVFDFEFRNQRPDPLVIFNLIRGLSSDDTIVNNWQKGK